MRFRTGSNRFLVVGALLVGIVGLSGCATKRFVGQEVSKSSAASERRISEVQSTTRILQSSTSRPATLSSAPRQRASSPKASSCFRSSSPMMR